MSLEVKPYYDVSGNIVTYNSIDYNLKEIPDEFMLRFDAITEEAEKKLINLINENTMDSKEELRSIMACMAREVINNEVRTSSTDKFAFNTFETSVLKPGEGMNWITEDPRFAKKIVVINLGSGVMFTLKNKVGKVFNIYLPRRSMFLLDDKNSIFLRGIPSRLFDVVNGKQYNRENRYSLYFASKIK